MLTNADPADRSVEPKGRGAGPGEWRSRGKTRVTVKLDLCVIAPEDRFDARARCYAVMHVPVRVISGTRGDRRRQRASALNCSHTKRRKDNKSEIVILIFFLASLTAPRQRPLWALPECLACLVVWWMMVPGLLLPQGHLKGC